MHAIQCIGAETEWKCPWIFLAYLEQGSTNMPMLMFASKCWEVWGVTLGRKESLSLQEAHVQLDKLFL